MAVAKETIRLGWNHPRAWLSFGFIFIFIEAFDPCLAWVSHEATWRRNGRSHCGANPRSLPLLRCLLANARSRPGRDSTLLLDASHSLFKCLLFLKSIPVRWCLACSRILVSKHTRVLRITRRLSHLSGRHHIVLLHLLLLLVSTTHGARDYSLVLKRVLAHTLHLCCSLSSTVCAAELPITRELAI